MTVETHTQLASFIWAICNLLRGPYKRNEYRKVILPFTVLRRFDCILAPTKAAVLKEYSAIKTKPESLIRHKLSHITKRPFYNLSKLDFARLLDDPNQLAPNLTSYLNSFSPNVRAIFERFDVGTQIAKMAEKDILYLVVQKFAAIDLSPDRVDNAQMGYVFEELIRIGAEQSNEEAGEHFTPREVIKLMVNLLLSPEKDLGRSHVVKTIYDPACGTGGMLSVAEDYIRKLNRHAKPTLYGQDLNDEAWAVCKSDMLIKGEDAENILLGDTFTKDGFDRDQAGKKWTFDYMLANPPFGVEWKQQQKFIENERDTLGFNGRFGAGTPRVNDGALLFLQHMLAKMRAPQDGGSRLAIVFNGSPLFTGDAGSGESEIRRWIIENDWLEAIVALPEQLFYNTGISTYLWVLTNRKQKHRKGRVQLIDARAFWVQMEKSLGNKRRRIGDPSDPKNKKDPDHIHDLAKIHGDFEEGAQRTFTEEDPITHQPVARPRVVSRLFDNDDFGYRKITVERPLRLNFQATAERIGRLEDESGFANLAKSAKKAGAAHDAEVAAGQARQKEILKLLRALAKATGEKLFKDRSAFLADIRTAEKADGTRLDAAELKAVLAALSERDETAEICRGKDGQPEPDPDLRDTESVPLKEDIHAYFKREVLPHVPDAWIDESKTKIGYEIPLNRHFYRYEPPRPLTLIEKDIRKLEKEIIEMLSLVTSESSDGIDTETLADDVDFTSTPIGQLVEAYQRRNDVHDVFGVILYTEEHPYIAKVLRDEDFWRHLNSVSGARWPIFAIRPEQGKTITRWPNVPPGAMAMMIPITEWNEPSQNRKLLQIFAIKDTSKLPLLLVCAKGPDGEALQVSIKIDGDDETSCHKSLARSLDAAASAIANVTTENIKASGNVFHLIEGALKQEILLNRVKKGLSFAEWLKSITSLFGPS